MFETSVDSPQSGHPGVPGIAEADAAWPTEPLDSYAGDCDRGLGGSIPGWLVGHDPLTSAPPSGFLADVLAGAELAEVPDAVLVDQTVAWERVGAWVAAKQMRVIAEYARRQDRALSSDAADDRAGDAAAESRADAAASAGDGLSAGSDRQRNAGAVIGDSPGFANLAEAVDVASGEIGCALTLTSRGAEDRVADAVDLVGRLPAMVAAMETGAVTAHKASIVAVETSFLADGLPDGVLRRIETAAVDRAPTFTAGQLRSWVSRQVVRADHSAVSRRRKQAVAERRVWFMPSPRDGTGTLGACLAAADAAACWAAIDALARSTAGPPDGEPQRTLAQRHADVLVDLLTGRSATGQRPVINVDILLPADALQTKTTPTDTAVGTAPAGTAPTDTTVGSAGASTADQTPRNSGLTPSANLVGFGPIDPELASELVRDGRWRPIVTDPVTRTVLDVGRTRYTPPAAMADLVRVRDRTCRYPGCRRTAARCELDHTVRFPDGPTSVTNLACLCKRHHRVKHRAGWSAQLDPDGVMHWRSPTGHRYRTYPDHENRDPPGPTDGQLAAATTRPEQPSSRYSDIPPF